MKASPVAGARQLTEMCDASTRPLSVNAATCARTVGAVEGGLETAGVVRLDWPGTDPERVAHM